MQRLAKPWVSQPRKFESCILRRLTAQHDPGMIGANLITEQSVITEEWPSGLRRLS